MFAIKLLFCAPAGCTSFDSKAYGQFQNLKMSISFTVHPSQSNAAFEINPLDPNPAVAARAVFPQSGRRRPEKRLFFHIFPHFSEID